MATQRNDERNGSEAREDRAESGGVPHSELESFGRSFTGRPGPLTQWSSEDGQDGDAQVESSAAPRSGDGFRGKGPIGHQRSDERLYEQVCDVLTDAHDLDASRITVSVQSGEVTLTGFVPDRLSKRRAEEHIERMSGVKDVINNLRVPPVNDSALGGVL